MSTNDELQADDLQGTDPTDNGQDSPDPDADISDQGLEGGTATVVEDPESSDPAEGVEDSGDIDDDDPTTDNGPPSSGRTFTSTKEPERTPKIGVILAGVTLVAALAGLVYYIVFPGSDPAYTINGDATSTQEMLAELNAVSSQGFEDVVAAPDEAAPEERAQLAQLLSGLIVEDILTEEAVALDVEVAQSDIDDELNLILTEGFAGDQAAFDDAISQSGLTEEGVQQQLRTTLLVEILAEAGSGGIDVTDADIQAAYDAQFSTGNVSHILVETEEEAQAVIDRIAAGEDFAALAQELSIDTGSGQAGGDLGPFQTGAFVPEFEEAVLQTAPGGITGPVETQFGFHVITVGEAPSLDEVRDLIDEGLRGQSLNGAIQALLTRLDGEIEVTVDPAFGEWTGLLQGGVLAPQEQLAEPEVDPALQPSE